MKKIIACILSVILLAILFVPVPLGTFKDGGTKVYSSLTYKIVKWKKFTDSFNRYEKTRVYFLPNNFSSLDTLWQKEIEYFDAKEYSTTSFIAIITETWGNDGSFLIKDEESDDETGDTVLSDDNKPNVTKNGKICSFSDLKVGDRIKITYDGTVMYSYPALLGKVYKIEILD